MGIVNATPDSFSDAGLHQTLEERVALAAELLQAGARLIDVGGESGVTNRPAGRPRRRRSRALCRVIERVAGGLGARVSVDTYKPAVARAAIAAGASIVNDVSGLRDPELADVCARPALPWCSCTRAPRPRRRCSIRGSTSGSSADVRASSPRGSAAMCRAASRISS